MAKQGSLMGTKPLAVLAIALLVLPGGLQNSAAASTWTIGDVFAAVGNGQYKRYSNMGAFQETISQGLTGTTTGCAFNALATGLYTTNFTNTKVFVFDTTTHSVTQTIDTAAHSTNSESIVFAQSTDFYVGHAGGNHNLLRVQRRGNLPAGVKPNGRKRGYRLERPLGRPDDDVLHLRRSAHQALQRVRQRNATY